MVTADNRRSGGREANDWEECQRIGHLLANEALRIVSDAPVQPSPTIFCAARSLKLPVDSPLMRPLLKALPNVHGVSPSGDTVTTQLNLLNIGNAQILTIPGEALPNIGYYLKRKMRGEHNLLFGLTNDAFGYISNWNYLIVNNLRKHFSRRSSYAFSSVAALCLPGRQFLSFSQ